MIEKIVALLEEYQRLQEALARPMDPGDPKGWVKMQKRLAEMTPAVEKGKRYQEVIKQIEEVRELISSPETEEAMEALAREELKALQEEKERLEMELRRMLLPPDPMDTRNVILEIRAGTGGEEAALFAGELFRMYTRYAEKKGWQVAITDAHYTDLGGVKELVAVVEGKGAYADLKFESGVHRVQRVPKTEASGRIHTSAATVAVLPEVEDIEIEVDEKDLRIDRFCASGPGGQHVNRTMSAVRITHVPTGIVVSCQDEKSQHQNLAKAMRILKARLYDLQQHKQQETLRETRRSQIGSGDRSEKIRTYNFPQGRVTDHRIGLTLYQLEEVLDGRLEMLIEPLKEKDIHERLANLG